MDEIWKDVIGYEGLYQVSDLGRVKSLSRVINRLGGRKYTVRERILKPTPDGRGYLTVGLRRNKKRKTFCVHSLVAMSFLDYIPDGTHKLVVDHIDNDKTNNRLVNLQIISQRENCSKDKRGSSRFTGVYWNKRRGKWRAGIKIKGKDIHLGYFKDESEASKTYQNKLKELNT